MPPSASITSVDWPKRVCMALASSIILVMLLPLFGWMSGSTQMLVWSIDDEPIRANTVVGLMLLGAIIIGVELGFRRIAWLALLPALLGTLTFMQDLGQQSNGWLDELFFAYPYQGGGETIARMSPAISIPMLLAGYVIVMLTMERLSQRQTLLLALVASAILSIGAATVLGHVLDLNLAFRWGYHQSTSPIASATVCLVGLTLLAQAWRENSRTAGGAPSWLPLPVIGGSATLTIILYLGLQDQELVRLREATNRSAVNLAREFEDQMENQINQLAYFALDWTDDSKSDVVRAIEAENFLRNSIGGRGGQSLSRISPLPDLINQETFPAQGNEHLINFSHRNDPLRRRAIERSLAISNVPQITETINLAPYGPGYAIYVPLRRGEEDWGFLVGEYLYDRVIQDLVERNDRLREDYRCRVEIAELPIFDNSYGRFDIDQALDERGGVSVIFPIYDRRVRFTVVRTAAAFARDRRNLPELMGAAGLGITILLGLSVHLARTAYTSLRSAEQSNQRLQAENEERRRVEAMLKVSDERLRLALDSTQIGIFEWNLTTNQIYYSPGLWNMLDYAPGDVADTPEAWTGLIHEDDLPDYRSAIDAQLSGAETFIAPEYRLRTGQGEWRWIYARAKTVARTPRGTPLRVIGTLQDISERKVAEAALRESQAESRKLSLVASRTDNLVIITSPDGRIDWVNESFSRVMEYELAEIYGRTPDSFLLGPDSKLRDATRIKAAMSRGRGITSDVVNYSKSGRKYHLHLELQPVRNERGEVDTFIAMLADITTRVETEQALRRAKLEADGASRAKSDFLASMSHEIRTPMNGVIGMTSLLLDTTLDPEQRDFVNTIRTSGEALLTIINDMLDFSKIESGKMELEELPFELPICVEEALELFAMQAASKNLDLGYHVESDVPAWVMGDITRLRQILVNLVNNAIKFTPRGNITITVRQLPRPTNMADDNYRLEFTVADTGIGIPSDRIDKLFQPFTQVDSSTTRKYGGTGLGLAICHRLCQLMNGDIWVESEEGQGTRFIFTIQVSPAHPINQDPLPALPEPLQKGTFLIIEDLAVNRQRLEDFATAWGATPALTGEAATALTLLQATPPPALVLLDEDVLRQPGGDQLMETIRSRSIPSLLLQAPGHDSARTAPPLPLVSVKKPVRASTLRHRIESLFGVAAPAPTAQRSTKLGEEIELNVLLVEDNLVNQKVALRLLDRLGYQAEVAQNGLESLTAVQQRRYDLVLMDVQMPEMDGFTACREIRRLLPELDQPKIIALTANALQGDREECLKAGMDDYITKPVKLHELEDTIRRQFAPVTETATV